MVEEDFGHVWLIEGRQSKRKVVALDNHGQPVTDRTADDFQITDGEKPQKISFFRAINQSKQQNPLILSHPTISQTERAPVPGRKTIIWVTDGVPIALCDRRSGIGFPVDFTPLIRQLSEALERSNIALYPIRQMNGSRASRKILTAKLNTCGRRITWPGKRSSIWRCKAVGSRLRRAPTPVTRSILRGSAFWSWPPRLASKTSVSRKTIQAASIFSVELEIAR